MAAGGAPYNQEVINELWLELWYMVQWINTGQIHRVDLYWALEIIRILDDSTGFQRGYYNLCRTTIIATAHKYNVVPKFKVYHKFSHLTDLHALILITFIRNN